MNNEDVLIYIAACIVNNNTIDQSILANIDYDQLLALAKHHSISSIIASGLYRAGVRDHQVSAEVLRAARRDMLFDIERERVIQQLEEKGIWYLPLKGIILKSYYPEPYLREMADNDILINPDKADEVRKIMTSLGYEVLTYEAWHHDNYTKKPFYHFEMHRLLIGEETLHNIMMNYYLDMKRFLKKDSENSFGYHMSDEDFYVFMIAHEYKHYSSEGTGLRSLLDTYVYLKEKKNMDWGYINREICKLGVEEFEKSNRVLAEKIFYEGDKDSLSEEENSTFKYLLQAGTYGNKGNLIKNEVHELGVFRYLLRRIFPPMEAIHRCYPYFYRHKVLIPFLPFYRLIHRREGIIFEIKNLRKQKK